MAISFLMHLSEKTLNICMRKCTVSEMYMVCQGAVSLGRGIVGEFYFFSDMFLASLISCLENYGKNVNYG